MEKFNFTIVNENVIVFRGLVQRRMNVLKIMSVDWEFYEGSLNPSKCIISALACTD